MITSLTEEQKQKMTVYRDKWIKIGLSTEPTNKERAAANVPAYYAAGKLPPPKHVMFAKSPMAAVTIINLLQSDAFWANLRKKEAATVTTQLQAAVSSSIYLAVKDEEKVTLDNVTAAVTTTLANLKLSWISNFSGGNLWAGWQAFYEYFDQELNVKGTELIRPTCALSQDVGWIFPYENVCLMVEKPLEINLDTAGRLHNEHGMAIRWGDGWGLYSLNGIQVPDWSITTPRDEIDPKKILGLTNTEQRMVLMKHVGLSKFEKDLGAEVIDTYQDYRLMYLKVENHKIGPYLYMKCPSTGREFLEGVGDPEKHEFLDPTIKTCVEALKWRSVKASKAFMTKFNLKWDIHA